MYCKLIVSKTPKNIGILLPLKYSLLSQLYQAGPIWEIFLFSVKLNSLQGTLHDLLK